MSYRKFQIYFFMTVLGLSLLLSLLMFRAYLIPLAFGGVLAIVMRPLYKAVSRKVSSDATAAGLTMAATAFVVILPLSFFIAALVGEIKGIAVSALAFMDSGTLAEFFSSWLPVEATARIPALIEGTKDLLSTVAGRVSSGFFSFFSNVFQAALSIFVILISAYYLLKDGAKLKKEVLTLSPLGDEYDELVLERVIVAVRAVMGGVIVIALLKAILGGIFFWVFGVPAPLFWGAMTGFASLLPAVGTAIVTGPIVVYLFLAGKVGAAIGLGLVSMLLISAVDNFLQPKLVESKTKIHPLLILMAILGGLEFYGFSGFILGPLTLAVTIVLIDIFKKEFKKYLEKGI